MGNRVVHDIHRRAVIANRWFITEDDTPHIRFLSNAEMLISRRDIDAAGTQYVAMFSLPHRNTRDVVQAQRKRIGKSCRSVFPVLSWRYSICRQDLPMRLRCA